MKEAANGGGLSGDGVEDEHSEQYARQVPSKHLGCDAYFRFRY